MGLDAIILVFWMLSFKSVYFPLLPSSRGSLVPLCFLPLEWYHLHIWGCGHFFPSNLDSSLRILHFNTEYAAVVAAKLLQLCPTLCDPIDGSSPGSPVPGILQARTLEWVAISFSNAWKWKVKGKLLSRVWLLATPWTAAYQARPSLVFQARVLEWGAIAFSQYREYYTSIKSLKNQVQQPDPMNSIR